MKFRNNGITFVSKYETYHRPLQFTMIGHRLIEWYEAHKRDLPWRNTADPYRIWISEIILQQTRVDQGLDYYHRFIDRFPDICSLAQAEEQDVLKLWQGLGYYSRARNLYATARLLVEKYDGRFPKDHDKILALKGIGDYTAAAISSFAWNMPYPAVDGNVFRVLSRLFAVDMPIDTPQGKKYFTGLAREIMPEGRAALFNQAIMEFGALQCVPRSPHCSACTLNTVCRSRDEGDVSKYPVKSIRTKTKDVYLYYFFIRHNGSARLKQRKGKGIWENLFEFPMVESSVPLSFEELIHNKSFAELFRSDDGKANYQFRPVIKDKKHVLSHRNLYGNLYEVNVGADFDPGGDYLLVGEDELREYPVHRLMQYFLEVLQLKK